MHIQSCVLFVDTGCSKPNKQSRVCKAEANHKTNAMTRIQPEVVNNRLDGRSLAIAISKIKTGCFNFKSFGNINAINDIYYTPLIIYNDLPGDGDSKVDSLWRTKLCR